MDLTPDDALPGETPREYIERKYGTFDINNIPVHPAADLFPMMSDEQFAPFKDDIKKRGQQDAIMLCNGMVLDGRNTLRACLELGIEPYFDYVTEEEDGCDHIDPIAYVISKNLHRRHLTPAQRREVVEKMLKMDPTQSNRQVAAQVKVDDKTVASVRAELEASAEIPQLEKTTGKDGKKRRAAKKRAAKKKARPEPQAAPTQTQEPESEPQAATDKATPTPKPKTVILFPNGTARREVLLGDITIPDLWHIAERVKYGTYWSKDETRLRDSAAKMILECWDLAHDLLRMLKEAPTS
jgi:hypothetical protein